MVLHTANYVRHVDSENTPPVARLTAKSSKVRTGIQGVSRRRRALVSGGAHHPRHAIEHAKKRKGQTSKSPLTSVRMDVPTVFRDVEMGELNDGVYEHRQRLSSQTPRSIRDH